MSKERFEKVSGVLAKRQPDLTVVLDGIHKPHNVAAIVRSCDAVGVLGVHRVQPRHDRTRIPHATSGGASKWVEQTIWESSADVIHHLQQKQFQVLVANFSASAIDYRQMDFTRPTAFLLGAELYGVSKDALSMADHEIFIPMMGMVESFNVSVACAILLAEAQRQRLAAGYYDKPRLSAEQITSYRFEWLHPKIAEICRKQGRPYPPLDMDGDVIV